MPYLVDTDILIDFFRKNEPAIDYLDSLGDWSLSVITGLELIAGAKDKREVAEIDNVLSSTMRSRSYLKSLSWHTT